VNSEIVANFEKHLKEYYDSDNHKNGIPGVAYFADKANLSAGYFGDLIKKETGNTPKDLISLHIINVAKHRLASSNEDVSIIAYDLGFEYPAHFSRMFKRIAGQSPSQFRSDIAKTQ
jgi:AraC-like DNA-binding protein